MNDWKVLRKMFSSNKHYAERQVTTTGDDLEDFKNWLIDQGCEIQLNPCQSEAIRFKKDGQIGIVYEKGSGNLLAHKLGVQYLKSIGIERNEYLHGKEPNQ